MKAAFKSHEARLESNAIELFPTIQQKTNVLYAMKDMYIWGRRKLVNMATMWAFEDDVAAMEMRIEMEVNKRVNDIIHVDSLEESNQDRYTIDDIRNAAALPSTQHQLPSVDPNLPPLVI